MDIAKKKKASIRSGKKKAGPDYKSKVKMKKAKSDYYDFNLVAVIILIMCFGLIMLYSTSSYMAQINEGDDMFYFNVQYWLSCAGNCRVLFRLSYSGEISVCDLCSSRFSHGAGKDSPGSHLSWSEKMAEAWGTVSAGRDCKDCGDHHIVLSDRQDGKESGNPESYYGTAGNGRHSGSVCLCVYR